jgi:CBS domain-containing protein
MADTGLTHFPVVDRSPDRKLLGMISLEDLLKARTRTLESERRRERVMRVRLAFPFSIARARRARIDPPPGL